MLPPGRCQSLLGQPAIKNSSGTRGSALSVEGPETPDGGHCLSGPAAALPPSAAQARQRLATTSRFTPIQTWVQDAERTDRSSTPVQAVHHDSEAGEQAPCPVAHHSTRMDPPAAEGDGNLGSHPSHSEAGETPAGELTGILLTARLGRHAPGRRHACGEVSAAPTRRGRGP